MATLTVFLFVLGVFLPAVFADERADTCPTSGDNSVDWTKDNPGTNWYYCLTSLKGRTIENCYANITSTEQDSLKATFYQYKIDTKEKEKLEFQMKHVADGKYSYPGLKTFGVNIKVTSDKKCLTYWKCPEEGAEWNGVNDPSAYFIYFCSDPKDCKPQTEYQGEFKEILDKALEVQPKLEGNIDDVDQKTCGSLYPEAYPV